jgi:hypothetical protein
LLEPIARKFVRSRVVVFVENQKIEDIVNTKEKISKSIMVFLLKDGSKA